jgi:hypothetical protein
VPNTLAYCSKVEITVKESFVTPAADVRLRQLGEEQEREERQTDGNGHLDQGTGERTPDRQVVLSQVSITKDLSLN